MGGLICGFAQTATRERVGKKTERGNFKRYDVRERSMFSRCNGLESTRTGWFRCLPGLGTCGDDHGDDGTKVDLGGMEGIYYLK